MSKNKFQLFTKEEEKKIMSDFNDIVNAKTKATKLFPLEKFISATKGMHFHYSKNDNIESLYSEIKDAHKNKKHPIVHDDSLTAWCNQAVEQYGLEIRDILAMKPGQTIKVIMMDRNIGEYTPDGKKHDPKKVGFTFATYTHEKGLKGKLDMEDIGLNDCFEWELNGGCNGIFWGPIPKGKTYKDFDKKTKVGWRGPSINYNDAKYLPDHFISYDTWWDDYPGFRTHDFIKIKRIKESPIKTQKGGNLDNKIKYKLVY